MLETSSDLLIIVGAICLIFFTGFLCYLIYSLTKIVQESKKTVEDVNKKMEKLNPVLDNATRTISNLMQTIDIINNSVLKPISSLGAVIKQAADAVKNFRK